MSFVFYDTETTGTNTSFDQILQFAAIRTDDELREIERFEIRCRLDDYIVPSAGALRVTGMTIDRITDPALPSHYEMVCQMRKRLSSWCPATFMGWNTIRFDELILRQAFYKCLHPPYLTNTNGNERADVLKLAQCAEAFGSGVLNLPTDEKGRPTFRLDRLAPANGFPHGNAHDALADVEATIHICRLIRDRAPEAWKRMLHCASKQRVTELISNNPVFILREYHSFCLQEYPLTLVGNELGGTGAVLAYNLSVDPDEVSELDDEAFAKRLGTAPKLVKRIRPNAVPLVLPFGGQEPFGDLSFDLLAARALSVREKEALRSRILNALAREEAPESEHVEEQIYSGFPTSRDRALMEEFHAAPWYDRLAIVTQFEDARYRRLARRLIYMHCPESLDETERSRIARSLAARMTGNSTESVPWLCLSRADEEAAILERDGNASYASMLTSFREFIARKTKMAAQALA